MKPGEAWNLASEALKRGDIQKAKELLPHMVKSDRWLMEKKIAAHPSSQVIAPESVERASTPGSAG